MTVSGIWRYFPNLVFMRSDYNRQAAMGFFSERNFSLRAALLILIAVFGAEFAITMLLGSILWPSSPGIAALADSIVLVFLLGLVFYLLISRPLTRNNRAQKKIEKKRRLSDEKFIAFAEVSPDIIALYNRAGCIIYANPAMERLLGFPLDMLEGRHASRLVCPDDLEHAGKIFRTVRDGSVPQSFTLKLLRNDKTICTVEAWGFSIGAGKKRYFGTILRDITKRQEIQQETAEYRELLEQLLTERTDHLEKLLAFSEHLTSSTDPRVLMRQCTQLTMDLLGLDFSSLMLLSDDHNGLVIRDTLGFPESMIDSFTLLKGQGLSSWVVENRAPATVVDFSKESRFEVPPMINKHAITSAICVPMMIANEAFGVLIGHTMARREFEEWEIALYQNFANQAAVALDNANHLQSLEESEKKFRSFFENISDPLFIFSLEGKILEVNRSACERMGYTRRELLQMTSAEIVTPDQVAMIPARIEIVKSAKQTIFESSHKTKDDEVIPVEFNCRLIEYEGNPAIIGVARDIRARQRAEAALRESEERYRDLFENASDLIQIARPDGRFLYVNRAWREGLGYSKEEVLNLSIIDVIDEQYKDQSKDTFFKVLSRGKVERLETTFVAKDGRKILVEGSATCKYENGRPESTRCIFRDVTEKRQLELELQKTEKLESVGVLAGGIAHDFNNLLTAIIGNISLAKIQLSKDDQAYDRLVECEKASHRAKDLTQQLLTFSKGGAPITTASSVADLIRDSASFMLAGSKTTCFYALPDDLWQVKIDAGQISQVIQNLVKNAEQAMPGGGRIQIIGQNITIEKEENSPIALKLGKYVKLCVIDSGHGIPHDKISQVFDPYFTTKSTGSGLGLAIAFSIMKRHHGIITVDSQEGQGASFCLYLPVEGGEISEAATIEHNTKISPAQGQVLVMDDEEIVRHVTARMLKHIGYEVKTAADGEQAIEMYCQARDAGHPFDVVIMDLTIPGGMGGEDAMKKLLKINPKVKTVVSSGYADDPIMANYREYGFSAVAPKPYKIQELAEVMKKVLLDLQ